MPELLQISFSPWSEKARWALDLSGIAYTKRAYQPLLGEPALRLLLRQWRGTVSVPVLRDGSRVIAGALDIARHAAEKSGDSRLFPKGAEARVLHYAAVSDHGMAAGRALSMRRVIASPEALTELAPRPLRRHPRLAQTLAGVGARYVLRKYGGHRDAPAVYERTLTDALDALRSGLAESASRAEPRTLLPELSYADIAMAQLLVFVGPPSEGLRMGPAGRAAFASPKLADRYADLLGWRDALYAHHRRPRAR